MTAPAPGEPVRPLNREQQDAVSHDGGPLLVLAPAGSGKTRVVIERLLCLMARSNVGGERFFVATFTRKAAGDLVERISRQHPGARLPWVGTFHSLAARLLRLHAAEAGLSPEFTVFDAGDQRALVRDLMRRKGIPEADINPQDVVKQISRWKNARTPPGPGLSPRLFGTQKWLAALYGDYEAGLSQNGSLDYDDLLLRLVGLLEGSQEVARTVRERFLHVLVDEYQDTNPLQEELIRLLSRGRTNVTVVGDDDQSIYQFRGADIRHIKSFESEYPGARRIVLSRNYRSTPAIVLSACAVIARNTGRYAKGVEAVRPSGSPVFMKELPDEEAEARFVASKIREWERAGGRIGDSAVLFRTHAQSLPFEKLFSGEGLPFYRKGGGGFLEKKEVKDLVSYLRVMANPVDRVCLRRILNSPPRGLGDKALESLEALVAREPLMPAPELLLALAPEVRAGEAARALSEMLREGHRRAGKEEVRPEALLAWILEETGYRAMIARDSPDPVERDRRLEGLEDCLSAARLFRMDPEETRAPAFVFLEELALSQQEPSEEGAGGRVALMTIHQAKGLEFDQVFVTGVEDQLLPIRGRTPSDIEEERRLFYVAMTRARARLFLSWCQTRRIYGKSQSYSPSPFLRDVPEAHSSGDSPALPSPRNRPGASPFGRTTGGAERSPARSFPRPPARMAPPREPAPPVAALRTPRPEWVGRVVRHPRFGTGTVLDAFSPDPDLEVVIRFSDGQQKTLLARVANLEIVGG